MLILSACHAVGLQLLMFATLLRFCQTKSLKNEKSTVNSTQSQIWQPKNGTMSDWLKCYGMSTDTCQRTMSKYRQLKELLIEKYGVDDGMLDNNKEDQEESSFGQCVWLTEEQIDMLVTEAKQMEDASFAHHRDKRTLIDFKKTPVMKWSIPVHYKFDGTHDELQKFTVRSAFQHWMDNTCIRFKELPTDAEFDDNHILLTSKSAGCHSYTGRVPMIPQPINLHEYCFDAFGVPVHEIGHSLGLWHEQMRQDRDLAIRIISENIDAGYLSEFALADNDAFGLPYNYGSVMHYSSKGASTNGKDTIIALDALYQKNMGQRTGLSFHDTKIINLAYCQDSCALPVRQPCQRGGYQNPNKCSACICPDGFSGQYCNKVAPAKHAKCGGVLNLTSESFEIIKSPGYDTTGYTAHQECTWWIKAPENHAVMLSFDGDFGIYCESESCFHWVEIKYKADLGLEGGRFCCSKTPDNTILSESNEMMIIFRSNYTINDRLRGFQAVVEPIFAPANRHHNQPKSPKVISTKSSTTSTTVAPSTTPRTRKTSSVPHRGDCERLDLTFLVDSSNSVGSDNWRKMLTFVNSIVAHIGNIGINATRVAVTTFGSSTQNAISLTSNSNAPSLRSAISVLPYKQAGVRDIADGLRSVRTQIYTGAKRRGVKSVCLLIIGGPSNVRASEALSEGELMRRSGVEVVVVAVRPLVNGTEASGIAGRRDPGVVYASSFSDILESRDETTKKLCASGNALQSAVVKSLFQCSFEEFPRVDSFCEMTQDKTDSFHWKMSHDVTPTNGTRPDFAFDGKRYVYIDASSSQLPNAEARLTLPKLNFTGEVCVDFYYHMFGIHVNTLQLVRSTDSKSTIIWMRSKETAKRWLHASVEVGLSNNSQLRFIGVRGYGNLGDIALDRICVKSGRCAH